MAFQNVFKRYELKYLMTREEKEKILAAMEPHMRPDSFGKTTIRNIYFDTDDHILARHSIMKPDFKEKLRIRSYGKADSGSIVFAEIKRKYDHIVYKRRIALPESEAMEWLSGRGTAAGSAGAAPESGGRASFSETQLRNEIDYFLRYYRTLKPAAFISYDREAYRMQRGDETASEDFRVTFDENILARDYDLSLGSDVYGEPVLENGMVLMELKCSGGLPLWMTEILSKEKIYKTSFSKYGTAYQNIFFPGRLKVRLSRSGYSEHAGRDHGSGIRISA